MMICLKFILKQKQIFNMLVLLYFHYSLSYDLDSILSDIHDKYDLKIIKNHGILLFKGENYGFGITIINSSKELFICIENGFRYRFEVFYKFISHNIPAIISDHSNCSIRVEPYLEYKWFYNLSTIINKITSQFRIFTLISHFLLLFGTLLCLSRFFSVREESNSFLFVSSTSENIEIPKRFDTLTQSTLKDSFNECKNRRISSSSVSRMKRKEKSMAFERISCMIIDQDYIFVMIWIEEPAHTVKPKVDIHFRSQKHKQISDPIITLSSLIGRRPVQIDFCLEYYKRGHLNLPSSFISPFQPFGQFVFNTRVLLLKISRLLSSKPFLRSNFSRTIEVLCELLGAMRCVVSINNEIAAVFCDSHLNEIPQTDYPELFSKLAQKKSECFADDIFPEDYCTYVKKYCFANCSIIYVIALPKKPVCDAYSSVSINILMNLTLFVYQMSFVKQQSLRFNHFIELLSSSKCFIFAEYAIETKEVINLKASSDIEINENSIMTLDFASLFYSKEEREAFFEAVSLTSLENGLVKQVVSHVNYHGMEWISTTIVPSFDSAINKTILTIIIEEISGIKAQEAELKSSLNDLNIVIQTLGLHKFRITENDFVLDNESLFLELGREIGPNRSLVQFVDPTDFSLVPQLKSANKSTLKLIDVNGKSLWYSAVSNTHVGFLFCVNNLNEVKSKKIDDKIGSTNFADMIIMNIDPISEKVSSFSGTPTIWDIWSVDRNTEFSKFVNFVYADQRSIFANHYSSIIKGSSSYWTSIIKLVKIGGSYEWFKMTFVRKESQIICFFLNVNSLYSTELKETSLFNTIDAAFISSKISLWQYDSIVNETNFFVEFIPGLKNTLFLSRENVCDYINNHQEFFDSIESSMEKGNSIRVICRTNEEFNRTLVFFGQRKHGSAKIDGICIDITEYYQNAWSLTKHLFNLQKDLSQNKRIIEQAILQVRTFFNNLHLAFDMVSMLFVPKYQQCVIETAQYISSKVCVKYNNSKSYAFNTSSKKNMCILEIIENLFLNCYQGSLNKNIGVKIMKDFPQEGIFEANLVSYCLFRIFRFINSINIDNPITCHIGFNHDLIVITFEFLSKICDDAFQNRIINDGVAVSRRNDSYCIKYSFIAMQPSSHLQFCAKKLAIVLTNDEYIKEQLLNELHLFGFSVIIGSSHEECLKILDQEKIDYLFIDNSPEYKILIDHLMESSVDTRVVSILEGYNDQISYSILKPLVVNQVRCLLSTNKNRIPKSVSNYKQYQHHDIIQRKVLIVEDDANSQEVFSKIFEMLGCEYKIVTCVDDLLSVLNQNEYNIVFVDCMLKGFDILSATKVIRKDPKKYSSIPIIGVSSFYEQKEEFIKAGMNEFLMKPIRINEIKEELRKQYE